jgi:Protein of unknown function (DUF2442)
VVRHGVLRLRFSDGLTGEVKVLSRMRGPVFEQARTPEGFGRVRVDPETGTVVWPGSNSREKTTRLALRQSERLPRMLVDRR